MRFNVTYMSSVNNKRVRSSAPEYGYLIDYRSKRKLYLSQIRFICREILLARRRFTIDAVVVVSEWELRVDPDEGGLSEDDVLLRDVHAMFKTLTHPDEKYQSSNAKSGFYNTNMGELENIDAFTSWVLAEEEYAEWQADHPDNTKAEFFGTISRIDGTYRAFPVEVINIVGGREPHTFVPKYPDTDTKSMLYLVKDPNTDVMYIHKNETPSPLDIALLHVPRPHLVRTYETGAHHFVMERCAYGSLDDYLHVKAVLFTIPQVRHLVREIFMGIRELYELGFVHQDFNDGCILFKSGWNAVLCDFETKYMRRIVNDKECIALSDLTCKLGTLRHRCEKGEPVDEVFDDLLEYGDMTKLVEWIFAWSEQREWLKSNPDGTDAEFYAFAKESGIYEPMPIEKIDHAKKYENGALVVLTTHKRL